MPSKREKGQAFEREVCEALSLWVTDGKAKDCFWRSAMSGGRSTVALKTGGKLRRQAGDISSVSREGHLLTGYYYVECKFYKDLELAGFMVKRRGALHSFWTDTVKKAAEHGKHPMLIAKQNFYPALVLSAQDQGLFAPAVVFEDLCEMTLFEDMLKLPYVRPGIRSPMSDLLEKE